MFLILFAQFSTFPSKKKNKNIRQNLYLDKYNFKKNTFMLGMIVHTCNSSIWEVKVEELWICKFKASPNCTASWICASQVEKSSSGWDAEESN